jgi:hypothetical protein
MNLARNICDIIQESVIVLYLELNRRILFQVNTTNIFEVQVRRIAISWLNIRS